MDPVYRRRRRAGDREDRDLSGRLTRRRLLAGALACLTIGAAPLPAGWSAAERQIILSFSPLPATPRDTTNRLSGNPAAIALGRALFFNPRLSFSGLMACATCHDPAAAFSSPTAVAYTDDGQLQQRHAPSVLDAAQNRWFFWDGRRDTLWGQALEAMGTDMRSSPVRLSAVLARDDELRARMLALAGPSPDAETLYVTTGKAIAAYVETLASSPSPFDRYVAALKARRPAKDHAQIEAGLRVFLREGQCVTCHSGPMLTDGEFHSARLPPQASETAEDTGRFIGLYLLATARYSAGGPFSDDPHGSRAQLSAAQIRSRDSWGEFKTPPLRNVSHRPRFMHDGRFATLAQVIDHYSDTPGATSLLHGDPAPRALNLTQQQKRDLLAFLAAL